METKYPIFLTIALLAVMLEEATGEKPNNPEYVKLWQEIEEQWSKYTASKKY